MASHIVDCMTGIIGNDEFDGIRDQLSECSEQEWQELVNKLAAEGKLEIMNTGTRYVFVE